MEMYIVLQPCTESLFLAIFHQFRDVLASVLVDLMKQHHQPVDPNNLHAILVKDAVYRAVGLAAFDLYDEVKEILQKLSRKYLINMFFM